MIIRQEPEKPEMQNTEDGTQKGGGREDKQPYAKPKGRCGGGLGVSRAEETRIQERRSRLGSVGGWTAGEGGHRAKSKPESENVYYMRRHLLAGGSDLVEGDCFSISPRQSSNTLATFRLFFALVSIQAAWFSAARP
jgi:hypothetical protein